MRKVSSLLKANYEAYILIGSLHTLTPLMKQHVLLERLILHFIQKENVTMKLKHYQIFETLLTGKHSRISLPPNSYLGIWVIVKPRNDEDYPGLPF